MNYVRDFSRIMFCEARFQIAGYTDVKTIRIFKAVDDVDIFHHAMNPPVSVVFVYAYATTQHNSDAAELTARN
jgi:hypothetical protein